MRGFWKSRLRRALWLWFFAAGLGIIGMAAAREYGEAGSVGWRRIASLVVVALMNVQAIWESVAPIAPSGPADTPKDL
jgi:hypothetical protein